MTPSRKDDVKSSARGSWHAIVDWYMKNPERRQYILSCTATLLKNELKQFCVKSQSIIGGSAPEQMKKFKWRFILKNANTYMPALLYLLRNCLKTPTKRDNENSVLGMIVCMLAKQRIPQLCLLQKIISLLLYSGHRSKKVNAYTIIASKNETFCFVVRF